MSFKDAIVDAAAHKDSEILVIVPLGHSPHVFLASQMPGDLIKEHHVHLSKICPELLIECRNENSERLLWLLVLLAYSGARSRDIGGAIPLAE